MEVNNWMIEGLGIININPTKIEQARMLELKGKMAGWISQRERAEEFGSSREVRSANWRLGELRQQIKGKI